MANRNSIIEEIAPDHWRLLRDAPEVCGKAGDEIKLGGEYDFGLFQDGSLASDLWAFAVAPLFIGIPWPDGAPSLDDAMAGRQTEKPEKPEERDRKAMVTAVEIWFEAQRAIRVLEALHNIEGMRWDRPEERLRERYRDVTHVAQKYARDLENLVDHAPDAVRDHLLWGYQVCAAVHAMGAIIEELDDYKYIHDDVDGLDRWVGLLITAALKKMDGPPPAALVVADEAVAAGHLPESNDSPKEVVHGTP